MAKVYTKDEALEGIFTGADLLAKAVTPNLGPNGRNAICDQKYDIPLIVNEGKNIFPDFTLEDKLENIGAVMLRDSALKTGKLTGDGTLTTAILTNEILRYGRKLISSGINPIQLRNTMMRFLPLVRQAIYSRAVELKDNTSLRNMLLSADEDPSLVDIVMDAIDAVGDHGVIQVTDSQERKTRLEVTEGIKYDYGSYTSSQNNRPEKRDCCLEEPYVLLVNYKLKYMSELEKILTQIIDEGAPILIIAADMEDTLLNMITENVHRNILSACVAHAPGHGDTRRRNLQALAQKTGAILIDDTGIFDLEQCGLEVCGRIGRAVIDKNFTTLTGLQEGDPHIIRSLRNSVLRELEQADDKDSLEWLQMTLSILDGKMAMIYAGGITDVEMFEKQHRIENMISAIRCARERGAVPGGGLGFMWAIPAIRQAKVDCRDELELVCLRWIEDILCFPAKQIADNAGADGSYVVHMILEHMDDAYFGYNTATGKFEDFRKSNIWDAAKTVVTAFEVATQTAMSLLTISAAVVL